MAPTRAPLGLRSKGGCGGGWGSSGRQRRLLILGCKGQATHATWCRARAHLLGTTPTHTAQGLKVQCKAAGDKSSRAWAWHHPSSSYPRTQGGPRANTTTTTATTASSRHGS